MGVDGVMESDRGVFARPQLALRMNQRGKKARCLLTKLLRMPVTPQRADNHGPPARNDAVGVEGA